MVCLYVNVKFQVKPLITGTSSSQTKNSFSSKMLAWTLPRCVPSLESLAQIKFKNQAKFGKGSYSNTIVQQSKQKFGLTLTCTCS